MSKFKNASGTYLTQALFFETNLDKSSVVYTLKENDHLGYPSLYRLYMETGDPTEYQFAIQHLDGWTHWEKLCRSTFFKPYVTAWRKELELRLRSEAFARIQSTARKGGKEAFQADKHILAGQWKPQNTSKRGAPTKQDIREAADKIASTDKSIVDDYERITGTVQ